jgi:hypothetical protein
MKWVRTDGRTAGRHLVIGEEREKEREIRVWLIDIQLGSLLAFVIPNFWGVKAAPRSMSACYILDLHLPIKNSPLLTSSHPPSISPHIRTPNAHTPSK